MTLDAAQRTEVATRVGTFRRLGWVSEPVAKEILEAGDLNATVARLQARNEITPGVARTILNVFVTSPSKTLLVGGPEFDDSKAAGYQDVIDRHIARIPDGAA